MLGSSGAFAAMVEGVAHTIEHKITLTLPGGVYPDVTLAASAITVEASTTTDLPAQSRMQVGLRSMRAAFTLSGQVDPSDSTKTAAWLFRRWSIGSPLYRTDAAMAPVTIDVGLYPDGSAGVPELIRKFTGYVDSYTVSADGSVSFVCVDRTALLRAMPAVPPVITPPPWNAGLTSEYAVEAVLRAATAAGPVLISSLPGVRPQCVLSVGLRTSLWPEVGTLLDVLAQPSPTFAPGPYGSGLQSTRGGGYTVPQYGLSAGVAAGGRVFVEFFFSGLTATSLLNGVTLFASLGGSTNTVNVGVTTTTLTVAVGNGTILSQAVTIDSGVHYFAAEVVLPAAGASGASALVYLDGTSYVGSGSAAAPWDTGLLDTCDIGLTNGVYAGLQVTTEASPTPNYPFTPTAVIDPSPNTLQVIPGIDATTDATGTLTVLQSIASAELAVAGFDESGIYRSQSRKRIARKMPTRTITSATSLTNIDEETLSAAVVNHAQVGFTGWTYGTPTTVWTLDKPWRVPGKSTIVRYVVPSDPVTAMDTSVALLPDSGTGTAGKSYYRASLDKNGIAPHPGLTITPVQVSSQRIRLTITNPIDSDAFLVAASDHTGPVAGTPVLQIGATPVTADAEALADFEYPDGDSASSRFGSVLWQLTGVTWIQDADSAQDLATDAVLDGYLPRPNLTNLACLIDPRVQLADVARIIDPDVSGVDEYVRIFGWSLDLSAWSMTIDGRTLSLPGGWIGGIRSTGGVDTYGY